VLVFNPWFLLSLGRGCWLRLRGESAPKREWLTRAVGILARCRNDVSLSTETFVSLLLCFLEVIAPIATLRERFVLFRHTGNHPLFKDSDLRGRPSAVTRHCACLQSLENGRRVLGDVVVRP
jgi:hypothetical protein